MEKAMQTLLVRLNEDERRLLDHLSAEGAGSRAAIVRQALGLLAGRMADLDPQRTQVLQELARTYAQAGVNLNQLARRLNSAGDIDAARLAAVLGEIIALNDATRRALGAAASSSLAAEPASIGGTGERRRRTFS
jgi:hypothetical protein